MHNCEEFRERMTEHIIDREDLAALVEFQRELMMCSSCSEFYAQSREMMEALSEIDLSISETQWNGIEHRLRASVFNVLDVAASHVVAGFSPRFHSVQARTKARDYIRVPILAGGAALVAITLSLSRLAIPIANQPVSVPPPQAVFVEHTVPLDPVTVDFLQESELLLRNVMKITPRDEDDLAEAKKIADEQLAELDQRKAAAAAVPPVVGVMETYETVLRDIRNVDKRNADDDISDIQKRIQNNGLIANMKAFQPRVTEVSFGLR